MLTNPIYAGAYAFGRTGSRITIEGGRKRIVRGFRKERGEWEALIIGRHEGYISWAEFERNQRLIADNANGKSVMSRGSVRRGEALLAGLLRCGHAAASFTSPIAVRTAAQAATTAEVGRSIMVASRASPLAARGLIVLSVPR